MDRQQWSCQVHTLERAVATCASCERAMCAQCVAEGDGSACGPCTEARRRARQARQRWLALAAVPLIGGAAALGIAGQRSASRREAERAQKERAAPEERMSCDRAAVISVGEGLLRQDNPQKALDLRAASCGSAASTRACAGSRSARTSASTGSTRRSARRAS